MAYSGEGNLIEAVVFGDVNKTVIPVVCDSDGKLIVDLTASTIEIGKVDQGLPAIPANAWPVLVENFPATQPVSGTVTVTQGTSPWITSVSNFPAIQNVIVENTLVPASFDYVAMNPTGTNPTTIVYKTGGSGGTTVATLTLTYDGNNNVQTVTKT